MFCEFWFKPADLAEIVDFWQFEVFSAVAKIYECAIDWCSAYFLQVFFAPSRFMRFVGENRCSVGDFDGYSMSVPLDGLADMFFQRVFGCALSIKDCLMSQ